jgi:hypothetical protein
MSQILTAFNVPVILVDYTTALVAGKVDHEVLAGGSPKNRRA